jgi:hypothetical protein
MREHARANVVDSYARELDAHTHRHTSTQTPPTIHPSRQGHPNYSHLVIQRQGQLLEGTHENPNIA